MQLLPAVSLEGILHYLVVIFRFQVMSRWRLTVSMQYPLLTHLYSQTQLSNPCPRVRV